MSIVKFKSNLFGNFFWIIIKMMSTVNVNWPSTIVQKWKFVTSTVKIKLTSTIDIKLTLHIWHKKYFNQHFFFNQHFLLQCFFVSGHFHILDIILTSCVDDVPMIFAIWHEVVKIRSIDVVSWYWPKFDVNLKFECPLGSYCWKILCSIKWLGFTFSFRHLDDSEYVPKHVDKPTYYLTLYKYPCQLINQFWTCLHANGLNYLVCLICSIEATFNISILDK